MNTTSCALTAALVAGSIVSACAPAVPMIETPSSGLPQPSIAGPSTCAPAQFGWDPTTADIGTKIITVAFEQEPDAAVGIFSGMNSSAWVWQMYGIGPGRWDDENQLTPYMAIQIPSAQNDGISTDGLTVTWKLKDCVFWSDGEPVTADDYVYTWKAIMDPASTPISRTGYDKIAAIDTPDDRTAVIHFTELYAAWPTLFDIGPNNIGGLLPAHIFQGKTGLEKDPQIHQPTWAAGPFAIKEWVAGDHMTLVRNPNYFGTPAKLDAINIKFVPDPETGLAALKAGDVDLMVNLAESDIETVQGMADLGIKLRVDPSPEFEHLFFNLGTSRGQVAGSKAVGVSDADGFCPFQDVNVRKAIAVGIDRLSFIKNYLKEDERAYIATLWPNSYWTNTSLTPYPYDPDQANQLLDAAGYPKGGDGIRAGTCNGKPVKFSLGLETTTAQLRIDEVLAVQSDLKKIGIEIKPNHIPAGSFFGSYSEGGDMPHGKFDLAIYTNGYYPDPDATGNWICSEVTSKDNPSGLNNYHICNLELDRLFAEALASADPASRKKVYDEIQQYQYDNVLTVPMFGRAYVYAYRDRFIFPRSSGYGNAFWDAEYFDIRQ